METPHLDRVLELAALGTMPSQYHPPASRGARHAQHHLDEFRHDPVALQQHLHSHHGLPGKMMANSEHHRNRTLHAGLHNARHKVVP